MMFNYPPTDVQNQGVTFYTEKLQEIRDRLVKWDINKYLPDETF
jgi:hypothetical protein